MNLSANAHLRHADEIKAVVVPAHDHKTESYLRIHLGEQLTVFPRDTAQALDIAHAILRAIAERTAENTPTQLTAV